jgi:hypothetical protein
MFLVLVGVVYELGDVVDPSGAFLVMLWREIWQGLCSIPSIAGAMDDVQERRLTSSVGIPHSSFCCVALPCTRPLVCDTSAGPVEPGVDVQLAEGEVEVGRCLLHLHV